MIYFLWFAATAFATQGSPLLRSVSRDAALKEHDTSVTERSLPFLAKCQYGTQCKDGLECGNEDRCVGSTYAGRDPRLSPDLGSGIYLAKHHLGMGEGNVIVRQFLSEPLLSASKPSGFLAVCGKRGFFRTCPVGLKCLGFPREGVMSRRRCQVEAEGDPCKQHSPGFGDRFQSTKKDACKEAGCDWIPAFFRSKGGAKCVERARSAAYRTTLLHLCRHLGMSDFIRLVRVVLDNEKEMTLRSKNYDLFEEGWSPIEEKLATIAAPGSVEEDSVKRLIKDVSEIRKNWDLYRGFGTNSK